ncbi:hypothetical protein BaRGS_00025700, partial [Batillaria attramentaria]
GSTHGGSATGSCIDVIENCAALGPNLCDAYVEFAHINCTNTEASACADKLSNCAAYGQTACTGQYEQWAKENCPKFCNLCTGQGAVGHTDVCYYKGQAYHEGAQWKDGCEKNCTCVDESRGYYLSGCEYKGQVYREAQQWKDGCDYLCTCRDGKTGYYECRALCVSWQNLGQCHLVDPAPGLCCKTPSCPPNVVIHYPDGYVPA